MASMRSVQQRFTAVLVVLLLLDAAAIALLMSPVGRSRQDRIRDYDQVRNELIAKRRDALPARDMDQKLKTARAEIDSFYNDRMPARYSDITDALGKLAKESHVQLGQVKYDSREADKEQFPDTTRLAIDANISGDYANEMRFINALEREKLLFILENVSLGEAQGGNIKLQIRLETYLRNQ
jgi:type IV pilus assembly protein PilO